MKKALAFAIVTCLILTSTISLAYAATQPQQETRVIIGFNTLPDASLIRSNGWKINREYHIIAAIAASLPTQAIAALRNNPRIAYIEEDIQVQTFDPELTYSWGVDKIDAEIVHATGNTGASIKVAVIDTGINYNHQDLKDNYIGGYDFVNNDPDPNDDNGHGTHCAGIIAAADNDYAVVGVAPQASLYALKALNSKGSGYVSDIVEAIQWATENSIQVISMSFGSTASSTALQQACDDAYYNHKIVLVAAAGNNGQARFGTTVNYPARYASVIAVGATDKNNLRASFSSTGPELELAAPGVSILSTYLNQDTLYMSGTSMACPHVAGTAALVLKSDETAWQSIGYTNGDTFWTNTEVRTVLDNTADDLGATGKDSLYGYGLVDADEAALPPRPQAEKTYQPTAATVTRGTVTSGDYTSLMNDDGSYFTIKSAKVNSRTQTIDWYTTTQIAENPSAVTSLTITYDGKYSTSITQKLYAYDYTTGSWLQIDSRTVSSTDTTITWSTINPSNYIAPTGDIRLRVYATRTTSSTFTCYGDKAEFTVKYTT